jgi:hypothetical protein
VALLSKPSNWHKFTDSRSKRVDVFLAISWHSRNEEIMESRLHLIMLFLGSHTVNDTFPRASRKNLSGKRVSGWTTSKYHLFPRTPQVQTQLGSCRRTEGKSQGAGLTNHSCLSCLSWLPAVLDQPRARRDTICDGRFPDRSRRL